MNSGLGPDSNHVERSASIIVPLKIYQISYKDNAKHFRYMYVRFLTIQR